MKYLMRRCAAFAAAAILVAGCAASFASPTLPPSTATIVPTNTPIVLAPGDITLQGASDTPVFITFVSNAGFLIEAGETKVAIDITALVANPSARRRLMREAAPPFDGIDLLLATHEHSDHYDADVIADHLHHNPDAVFVSPPAAVEMVRALCLDLPDQEQRLISYDLERGERNNEIIAGVNLETLWISHGGRVDNFGFIFDLGGYRFFHTGDMTDDREGLALYDLPSEQIDFAFVPIYHLTEWDLQDMIFESIQADRLIPMHFYGVRDSMVSVLRQDYPDAVLFEEEMQRLVLLPIDRQ